VLDVYIGRGCVLDCMPILESVDKFGAPMCLRDVSVLRQLGFPEKNVWCSGESAKYVYICVFIQRVRVPNLYTIVFSYNAFGLLLTAT
jgi:hypothetical protein